jgi:ABC-type Fe3+-hydroxamate transport system substrate-binding protein
MTLIVQDDRNRELRFSRPPQRIVSLVPSDTYSVAALGCGARLVGRTDYCELPESVATSVPSVGGTKNPRVDAILELAPDLVIANQEENSRRDLEKLVANGIAVYIAFPKRVAEGIAHVAKLARILGVEREGAVVDLVRRGYELLRNGPTDARPVPTFCPIWMDPLMTIHGDTFISDMLAFAGARNVFADRERRYPLAADLDPAATAKAPSDRDTRYPRVTIAEVIARAPELVLLPDEPHPFSDADAAVFQALSIPAAEQRHVFRCQGKDLCWYGAWTIDHGDRLCHLVSTVRQGVAVA